MNRALRRRHRVLVTAVAALLPVLLVVALASRPGEPRVAELPFAPHVQVPLISQDIEGGSTRIEVSLAAGPGPAAVFLRPVEDLRRPDVLVYWVAEPDPASPEPPRHLLGALAGTQLVRLPLPERFDGRGRIELVSLAHGRGLGGFDVSRISARGGDSR